MSYATEFSAFSVYCWSFLFWNLLTNCLPNPPFVEMKNLKLFHARSLVSLEIDLVTKLLSLSKTIGSVWIILTCLEQSPWLRWLLHEQALSHEAVYKHCIVKVWVALPHAEGSTENIFQDIFGFNCTYLLSGICKAST